MSALLDAFWRAGAYCLHPRVILLSLLPLLLAAGLMLGLGWFYWDAAVAAVNSALESVPLLAQGLDWLGSAGGQPLRSLVAPLLVIALAVPAVVVISLLLVALLMTPAIVELVARRRFPALERKHGGGWLLGALWGLACTAAALLALVISIPLWFVPPMVLILPPLIWGWLTYRVFAFDVLAEHASGDERRALLREHRWPLLGIGVICGYLGAAPSLLWAAGALSLVFAPLIAAASIWLYTLVFAFSACWFAHYALAALYKMRTGHPPPPTRAPTEPPTLPPGEDPPLELPAPTA